jgi:hypothetical protein
MLADARWIASAAASALHAAQCQSAGVAPPGSRLTDTLADEAAGLIRALESLRVEPAKFFAHAIPQSLRFDVPRQLAEVTLAKLIGPPDIDSVGELARSLSALFAAFRQAQPEAVEELELRSGPLRGQWEARGPGLLATLRQLTESGLVAESADVILVQPVLGGGGAAHPLYNAVHFEALLANPLAELPEIVRLGWLWGQLHLDLPKYEDAVGRARMQTIGPLALVPPVLTAAQEVELARCDHATIGLALEAWHAPAASADLLLDWWATYQASSPEWSVALAALDRLLSAE